MSILRVEQDGIEFYTEDGTGSSGMSIAGLARLCGVQHSAIRQLLQRAHGSKTTSEWLKVLPEKDLYLAVNSVSGTKIITAEVCTAIIGYFAFESRNKTREAEFAFKKFAHMGMERWIQTQTHWPETQPAPELPQELVDRYLTEHHPEGTVAITANPHAIIKILKESDFSVAAYRIFLYLEAQGFLGQTPTIEQICRDLDLNRPTVRRWIHFINVWSECASEIQLQTRQGTEFDIQRRMHAELGGKMEVYTPAGRIDLVTDTEIIEIKRIAAWKDAFGEVMAKGLTFPKHRKRIHLFGKSDKRIPIITSHCQTFKVNVSFESIAA